MLVYCSVWNPQSKLKLLEKSGRVSFLLDHRIKTCDSLSIFFNQRICVVSVIRGMFGTVWMINQWLDSNSTLYRHASQPVMNLFSCWPIILLVLLESGIMPSEWTYTDSSDKSACSFLIFRSFSVWRVCPGRFCGPPSLLHIGYRG
jgi:hypothetical protein